MKAVTKKEQNQILKAFAVYEKTVAEKTYIEYARCLAQILSGKINISSRAKYSQYAAVLSKLSAIGIDLGITLPKYTKRGDNIKRQIIDKYLGADALATILAACPKSPKGVELQKAIQLSYYAGLRLSEVLALKAGDVVFNGHVKIYLSGKGNKTRTAYLPLDRKALMENFRPFTLSITYIETTVARIRQATGLDFTFHSLRHSYASNMLQRGISLPLLQKMLGHTDLKTTAVYLHVVDATAELEKLGF